MRHPQRPYSRKNQDALSIGSLRHRHGVAASSAAAERNRTSTKQRGEHTWIAPESVLISRDEDLTRERDIESEADSCDNLLVPPLEPCGKSRVSGSGRMCDGPSALTDRGLPTLCRRSR